MGKLIQKFRSKLGKLKVRARELYWLRVSPVDTIEELHWSTRESTQNKRLCLFSTFDPNGKIDSYVIKYVQELHACGFDVFVISTSPSLATEDIDALKPYTKCIIRRKNVGIDFGSWKAGLEISGSWDSYESILIANDSVYGPFGNLDAICQRCDATDADAVGLTDSFEIDYHLQSYFIYFKKSLLQSLTFKRYFDSIKIYLDKYAMIDKYEVGLSKLLLSDGFKIEALYPYTKVKDHVLKSYPGYPYREKLISNPINQTLYLWEPLIKDFQMPFIKTEILKLNRTNLPAIERWKHLIPEDSQEWRKLIENHLKRVFPNAPGLRY